MTSWPNDIADMHEKFGVTKWTNEASFTKQSELLKLRMRMLLEEFQETMDAYEVLHANKSKEVGIKEGRPNKLGLPDLIKPYDWEEPLHVDNFGRLKHIFKDGD